MTSTLRCSGGESQYECPFHEGYTVSNCPLCEEHQQWLAEYKRPKKLIRRPGGSYREGRFREDWQ